ncbi:MAG TPA: hypothetical protein VHD56_08575 [Tepidisphaeraceae bacterium]|nr:hypothetical protein [Tepidisphaeraceae bacterium]
MDVLMAFGWASNIRVPNIFDLQGNFHTLDETLLSFQGVYQPLVFCIGMALLFSKERLRRGSPLDWTRRWGIICSYIVLLLSAMILLFIGALILAGIGALFMSMPLKYQPGVTRLFVDVSTGYLFYGASPTNRSEAVLVAFSSITVLLCCVPLLNALRSSGPKFLAAILLAPLALFALINLVQAGRYWLGFSSSTSGSVLNYNVYFYPMLFARYFGDQKYLTYLTNMSGSEFSIFLIEATKWCIILTIAIWLTIAQIDAWRQNKKAGDQ